MLLEQGLVPTMIAILLLLAAFLIFLAFMTIALKIALGLVKSEHTKFGNVFITSLVIVIVIVIFSLFIPLPGWIVVIIALIVLWLIISARHNTGFGRAILVSIIALIVAILLVLAIIWIIFIATGTTLEFIKLF